MDGKITRRNFAGAAAGFAASVKPMTEALAKTAASATQGAMAMQRSAAPAAIGAPEWIAKAGSSPTHPFAASLSRTDMMKMLFQERGYSEQVESELYQSYMNHCLPVPPDLVDLKAMSPAVKQMIARQRQVASDLEKLKEGCSNRWNSVFDNVIRRADEILMGNRKP